MPFSLWFFACLFGDVRVWTYATDAPFSVLVSKLQGMLAQACGHEDAAVSDATELPAARIVTREEPPRR